MTDNLKPLFPITAEIPLDGEGWYDAGSKAVCVVNLTQPLRRRLYALNDRLIEQTIKNPYAPVSDEDTQEGYEIAAHVIQSLTLNGQSFPVATADDVRRIDEEIDGRLVNFLVWEAKERGDAGVTGKRATFRADRETKPGKAKPGSKDAHPGSGAVADADKAD